MSPVELLVGLPYVVRPMLDRRILAKSSGWGGMSRAKASINASLERAWSPMLNRFSNQMVELGFPLMWRPQTEPAEWAG